MFLNKSKWIDPKNHLPPQGKKILYFSKGDVYVVQRFGKYWLPIPFFDSKFAFHDEPELWSDIDLPHPYSGLVRVIVDGNILNIDQLEIQYPDKYKEFVKIQLHAWGIRSDE